jgi:hypothetical protein
MLSLAVYAQIFFRSIHEFDVKAGMICFHVLKVLAAGKLRASLFWHIAPRRWVIGARRFETASCFLLQWLKSPMKTNLLDSLTTED